MKDGLIIAEYLREVRNVTKLGVHGESLGGCIAWHIANNVDVTFLFADRTFASLDFVAKHSFGVIAGMLFKYITKWNHSSVDDYLAAKCYKVVANDYEDTIVTDMASIKAGIANKFLSKEDTLMPEEGMKTLIGALGSLYKMI